MAIFMTGDTHGDFSRLRPAAFYEQVQLTKADYLVICGDFGGIWDGSNTEQQWLDWLENRPFTTLFVSGNHENFDLLCSYPINQWHGGLVQVIRPSVLHLMRGQLYEISGKRIFTMGGASSHDIQDGILEPDDPNFERKLRQLNAAGALFRVDHHSWWKEELPDDAEYQTARETLDKAGWDVDYIITHCCPSSIQEMDSIRIKDRRTWFRYSEGIGGDAITFLQRFYNKSFPEAVEYLLTWHGRARDSPPVSTPRQTKEKGEKVPFTLPPANVDHRRVFAYLRKRGIEAQVIRGFVEAGLLYEDAQHHNCVFVGRDQSGAPVFANQRGTYDWNGSSFKGDVPGSNKDIAFRLYCSKKHDAVLVFEAPNRPDELLHPAPESNLQRGGTVWAVRRRTADLSARQPTHTPDYSVPG